DVIMVEQRIDQPKKYFLRWTYFGDGRWYPVQTKDGLPFWKPDLPAEERADRRGKKIMVHEGPTKAEYLTKLKETPKKLQAHPWGHILKEYDHWGICGGAERVDEARWDELRAEAPLEVVYVADNDAPGRRAIPIASRLYRGPMK